MTHGWLPLHLACHKDASPGAIRVLLEYYPEAAKIGGKLCGSLPLHLATRNGCDSEILKMLFEAYPGALDKKNSMGDTPWQSLDAKSQRSLSAMSDEIASH